MCPKGFDPLATFTDFRSITIETKALGGTLAGYFKFTFNGETFAFPAVAGDWDEVACQQSFESLPNIGTVKCSVGVSDNYGSTNYLVQFLDWPATPYENNIYSHNGNPPNSAFSCDVSSVTGALSPTCNVLDVSANSVGGTVTPSPYSPYSLPPILFP